MTPKAPTSTIIRPRLMVSTIETAAIDAGDEEADGVDRAGRRPGTGAGWPIRPSNAPMVPSRTSTAVTRPAATASAGQSMARVAPMRTRARTSTA